jgi:hypothetical protein
LQESTTLIIDIPLSEDLLEKYNYWFHIEI